MEPHLDAIGIVTADLATSCRFYALLGVPAEPPPADAQHHEASLASGVRLMWDSVDLIRKIDPDWQQPTGHRMALAFDCHTPAGVDATHAAVVAAGFAAKTEPWDAFWGQRYAQVVDPDGNVVDLFAAL